MGQVEASGAPELGVVENNAILMHRVGGPAVHDAILSRADEYRAAGEPVPLPYELYSQLKPDGSFSWLARHRLGLDKERADLVSKLVPDIAATIVGLETAQGGRYGILHDPARQISRATDTEAQRANRKYTAEDVARQMRNVVAFAWMNDMDSSGNYVVAEDGLHSVYPLRGFLLDPDGKFLRSKIEQGLQDTFAVFDNDRGKMMATFCSVKKTNPYGRQPTVELGRTATDYRDLKQIREHRLSMRGVSHLRLLHMLVDRERYGSLEGKPLHYAYSDIRVSGVARTLPDANGEEVVLVPDGRAVQGTFFGGMERSEKVRNPVDLGFAVWGAGWQYVMGDKTDKTRGSGCEPFARIIRFFEPKEFIKSMERRDIWVPDEATGQMVRDYLSSVPGLDADRLSVRTVDSAKTPRRVPVTLPRVRIVESGLDTAYTGIDFADVTQEARKTIGVQAGNSEAQDFTLTEVMDMIANPQPDSVIDHKVPYIEAYCECTTPKGSSNREDVFAMRQAMQRLHDLGFTPTGIIPSDKTDGIRLVFSLITPYGLSKGLVPHAFPYRSGRIARALAAADRVFGTPEQPGPLESRSATAGKTDGNIVI